jgi:hypothetical protein
MFVDLKIAGHVVELLEEQSGEGKNGPWRKRDFVIETEGNFPAKVCLTQWGDEIDRTDLQVGERLTAHIDIRSREYQGRWYTDVKAWRIEKDAAPQGSPDTSGGPPEFSGPPPDDDDMPF